MVCDNLNTHDKSSFYETFPPAEALRLAKRFEFHYTPKHGSWLDIAEIELSALSKQCLGKRRIDNLEDLNSELENGTLIGMLCRRGGLAIHNRRCQNQIQTFVSYCHFLDFTDY